MGGENGETGLLELGEGGGLQVLGLCHLELGGERTLGTQLPGVGVEVCSSGSGSLG